MISNRSFKNIPNRSSKTTDEYQIDSVIFNEKKKAGAQKDPLHKVSINSKSQKLLILWNFEAVNTGQHSEDTKHTQILFNHPQNPSVASLYFRIDFIQCDLHRNPVLISPKSSVLILHKIQCDFA